MTEKLGKTGDFPRGKLNATDEGGLKTAVLVHEGVVKLIFNTPVAWIGLDKETAIALGNSLIEKANTL